MSAGPNFMGPAMMGGGAFGNSGQFPNMAPANSDPIQYAGAVGNPIKSRELMYSLMASQLFYDGHQQLAVQITNNLMLPATCPPSERMLQIFSLGLEREAELKHKSQTLHGVQRAA